MIGPPVVVKTNTKDLIVLAGVASATVTVCGGMITLLSVPFGVATIGLGLLGAVGTVAGSYLP